ncbi:MULTISPECIES: thiamine ABC transporter ATP-binding protein [unclassified Vibrio]|uniref:Thiamine ABC transporter ATP-binding protein n=1 Tax=Vibrio sp. HB236076 TaxID=3232307 RepID=A0AB39HHK2_9VIBR|nr:thiamine ABC transporter ATP-binding protein [Vibrio sp. HB161653]MDP5255582.1 thiamine ABC transporter ATP-binding protein [Vibrio sp. HB161653]
MTHQETPLFSLQQVIYDYQNERFAFDLNLYQGQILALMGPSGAGKSTLLALAAGFISPLSGQVRIDGQDMTRCLPHQRPLAFLFQEHNLFHHLSVADNIALGIHPGLKLSVSEKQAVHEAAKQVGLGERLTRLPEQLSGGQKQRVALARCFVQNKKIWLLDEPFSALDPQLRIEMLELVSRLAKERGVSVVMVTHHLTDARAIASHVAYMSQGQVKVIEPVEHFNQQHSDEAIRRFVQAGE